MSGVDSATSGHPACGVESATSRRPVCGVESATSRRPVCVRWRVPRAGVLCVWGGEYHEQASCV